jgi:hypothetical protein
MTLRAESKLQRGSPVAWGVVWTEFAAGALTQTSEKQKR